MKASDREEHLRAAQDLHDQLIEAGFTYGCLEVSLTALGAQFSLQNVDDDKRQKIPLSTLIEKSGLKINWLVGCDSNISADDINALLQGQIALDENYPTGEVVGYLWSEHYPDQAGHALAIFPDQEFYLVMDTSTGGLLRITAEQLARSGNYVTARGGSFEIAQVKV